MSQIRLYLDEDVDPQLAEDLRRHGFDVEASSAVGLMRAPDRDQLEYARQAGRAILTHNRDDFLRLARLLALSNLDHDGILYVPQLPYRSLFRRLVAFLGTTDTELVRNLFTWIPEPASGD